MCYTDCTATVVEDGEEILCERERGHYGPHEILSPVDGRSITWRD